MISCLGHLLLLAVILVLSPASKMLRGKPEIMNINLTNFNPPGPAGGGEVAKPAEIAKPVVKETPKPVEHEIAKKPEKAVKAEKKEAKVDKPKADGKGGIDVSRKVGTGSDAGEGANLGGGTNLPYNLSLVLSVIERAWRNPVTAARPITCTIYFQIDRTGNVIGEPIVEKSSGIAVFDQSAIYSVKRAGQFPPFPDEFNYDYIGLHLDFEYAP